MIVWTGERIENPHARLRIDVYRSPTLHETAGRRHKSLVLAASDEGVEWDKGGYSYSSRRY